MKGYKYRKMVEAVRKIRKDYAADAFKEHSISPLVNIESGRVNAYVVQFIVSSKYHYDIKILNEWMVLIGADECTVKPDKNRMIIKYKVIF